MMHAAPFAATVAALAGIGFAVTSLDGSDRPKPKKDKYAAAVDTLEQQLQRRFHDRNNVTFGYERVIRYGSRRHNTVLAEVFPKNRDLSNDDGQPLASRSTKDGGNEIEIANGVWIPAGQLKQIMHAENDDEKNLMAVLRTKPVAIYTAGAFDTGTGLPLRMKGPAYLRYNTPDAPAREQLATIAAKGWKTKNDADEMRQDGWSFRVVKVKADDETCVQCHTDQLSGVGKDHTIQPYKINESVGVVVIATKPK